jgi:Ca2+-binding RTX toxin-like protein
MNIYGTSGADTLLGGSGADLIYGFAGNDFIDSGAGDDILRGDEGNDTLLGGAGSDVLIGGPGNDAMDGGVIADRINYIDYNAVSYAEAGQGVVVDLGGIVGDGSTGSGFASGEGTDLLRNVNWIAGSAFADRLVGSSAAIVEIFDGGPGDDSIDGGAIDALAGNFNRASYQRAPGPVIVDLGAGTATGADGDDTLVNINMVRGSDFADTLIGSDRPLSEQFEGRAGNDVIDGRGGPDVLRYDASRGAVSVNLATGIAQDGTGGTDAFVNIEGVRGSNFADVLTGGNPANGVGATDGFELFLGNGGNDLIDGGGGFDVADFHTSTSGVAVTLGGTGFGWASDGLGGMDTLINIEGVQGSAFDDVLTGSDTGVLESFEGRAGDDVIDGAGGVDRVDYAGSRSTVHVDLALRGAYDGWGGTDTLLGIEDVRGSAFDDLIAGDAGRNRIDGAPGNDTIDGREGLDTAAYAGTRAEYAVSKTDGGWTVSGANGIDTLVAIERLSFSDGSLALDLDGNAGEVAAVAGAVFGREAVADRALVGIGLSLLDAGMGSENLMRMALEYRLGAAVSSHTAVVQLLYENVVGVPPPPGELASYVDLLDRGVYSVPGIGVMAAATSNNLERIDFIGLAQTGIEY